MALVVQPFPSDSRAIPSPRERDPERHGFSAVTARGACYGFEIRSTLPFDFLRSGSGVPLHVEEGAVDATPLGPPLQSWPEIPGKRMPVRLYGGASGYVLAIGAEHTFTVDLPTDARQGGRITMSPTGSPQARERLLWTTPAAVAITARGDLAVHASAVEVDGGAILITGPGGSGKTTTAAAFFHAGYRVLADDLVCCRSAPGSVVLPGPALLRVNPDAASRVLGVDAEADSPSRAKVPFAFPAHRRGDGNPVPLIGVVMLRAGEGATRVEHVPPLGALQHLWPSLFHLPGDEHRARTFQLLAELLGRIAVWDVSRALDWAALPSLVDTIAARCRR